MVRTYRDLTAWQKAYSLSISVYRTTDCFPKEERYGLTSQMRRASVSIPSNIAEGCGRKSTAEYIQLLYVAYGSLCELETQIMLSRDLGYFTPPTAAELIEHLGHVERLLDALIRSLELKRLASQSDDHSVTGSLGHLATAH
jgi:four helix bundle protein